MDLLSALVEAGSVPSELLQQMLVVTESVPTVKEQQLQQQCSELRTELSAVKQHLSSEQQSHAELRHNFLTLYRVACQVLAQRDAEICRLRSRVDELMQLVSGRMTAAQVTSDETHQELCVVVGDRNSLTDQLTDSVSALNDATPHRSDDINRNVSGPSKSVGSAVVSVKGPSQTSTPQTSTGPLVSADKVICNQKAVLTNEQQPLSPSAAIVSETSNGVTVSVSDAQISDSVRSSPAVLQLSSVQPSTVQMSRDKSAAVVEITSSSAVESYRDDVGVSAPSIPQSAAAGHATLSSTLPACSVSTDRLASGTSEQLLTSTADASSLVLGKSKVVTEAQSQCTEASKSSMLISSVSLNSAVTAVAATLHSTITNPTNTVSSLTSLDKLLSIEHVDEVTSASVSKKRRRRESSAASAEVLETGEKDAKCAKLDEGDVNTLTATQPPVPCVDTVSPTKVTGLTDQQRVKTYKMIAAREERARLISLKADKRLRGKAVPADKGAVEGDDGSGVAANVDELKANKSPDELNSGGRLSASSPRKPARRVPFLTVSDMVPSTPTLFTLRSRARLAKLNAIESKVSSDVHSADTEATSRSVPAINQRDELATIDKVLPHGSEVVCNKPQSNKSDRQSKSSEKLNSQRATSSSKSKVSSDVHSTDTEATSRSVPEVVRNKPQSNKSDRQSKSSEKLNSQLAASSSKSKVSSDVHSTDKEATSRSVSAIINQHNELATIDKVLPHGSEVVCNTPQSNKSDRPSKSSEKLNSQLAASSSKSKVSSDVHSTDVQATSRSVPAINQRDELATIDKVLPHGSEVVRNKPQSNKSDRPSKSSEKLNSQLAASSCADANDKLNVYGKQSQPLSAAVVIVTTSPAGLKPVDVTTSARETPGKVADTSGKMTSASKRRLDVETRSTRSNSKSSTCKTDTNSEPRLEIAICDKTSKAQDISQQTSSSSRNTRSSRLSALLKSAANYNPEWNVTPKENVTCAAAKNTVGNVTKDGNRRNSEYRNGSSQFVSVSKQQDITGQDMGATSQPSNSDHTSVVCNKNADSVPHNKDLSQEAAADVNRDKVIRRTSPAGELCNTVLKTSTSADPEKQVQITCKPANDKQEANLSFDVNLSAKTSSPLTSLSISRKESVDLFDVAIAGTPAQNPLADDSSDSLLSSPFDANLGNEGVDTVHEDVAFTAADFIVPDNPAAELVDASLFGGACSTCCDTCCSTCCSTQPGVHSSADTKRHADTLTSQGAAGQTASGAGTPSSPFKIFRSSERRSNTDDSLEDSSNTLCRTPPYAGIDVEEVERPLTEEDGETDGTDITTINTVARQSHQLDTEVAGDANKPSLNIGSRVNVLNIEEPTLLRIGTSNTLASLFGEVSDSDSEPSCSKLPAGGPAANKTTAVSAVSSAKPTPAAKLPSADVEEGEITDSDTEPAPVLPSVMVSVADKENAIDKLKTGSQPASKQRDSNQKASAKLPNRSKCVKASASTSHTPPRNRTSSNREQNPNSGDKNRMGHSAPSDGRNRPSQVARNVYSDRKERPVVRERGTERRDNSDAKFRPSGRMSDRRPTATDHRQLSPRNSNKRSPIVRRRSTNSSSGRGRNASTRSLWPSRR